MKKQILLILLGSLFVLNATAQKSLYIQRSNGVTETVETSAVESLTFSDDGSMMTIAANGNTVTISTSEIKTMKHDVTPTMLSVKYDGENTTVVNPYFTMGVSVTVNGANVVVENSNATTEFTYELSGSTTNGSFLYNAAYKSTIVLAGVSIHNPVGPAIDIECGKRIAMELKKNTENTLSDGNGGDWKAALYCKGHLEIDKSGTLNVTGNTKHAISAKEYIQLKKSDGRINILGAKGDGIHCGQYFLANGYNVSIDNVADDGIQAELSAVTPYEEDYADGSLWIQGGTFTIKCTAADAAGLNADTDVNVNAVKTVPTINITSAGAGSKGIKAGRDLCIEDGTITIVNSGTSLAEGTDVQTAKCLKVDGNARIIGGVLDLSASGAGGKCIKVDGTFTMGDQITGAGPQLKAVTTGASFTTGTSTGGTTGGGTRPGGGGRPGGGTPAADGSSAKAIKVEGAVNIYGGELYVTTATNEAEGLESKTSINIAGGKHYLKCYDDAINCSGVISFNGGITVCISTGNDATDSNANRTGAIVIGDGVLFAYTTKGGPEMGLDCDGNSRIQITGHGTVISAGGNQGGSTSNTISGAAQGYAFITTSISFQTGRYYTLADSTGENLVTFNFEANVSSSCTMFTANGMQSGKSYNVKYSNTAPTDATTAFHGLYLGSSAVGTTNVTSFTAK